MKLLTTIQGILLLFASGTLSGQTTESLLGDFAARISKAPAIEAAFIWNETAEGTMILQGNMFYISMDEFFIYCNGEKKWFYNQGIDQWEELPHDKNSADVLENPSAFFSRLNEDFYHPRTPVKKTGTAGKPLWELSLVPHSIEGLFSYVVMTLDAGDMTPLRVRYALSDGSEYTVKLLSFKNVPLRPESFFSPDVSP